MFADKLINGIVKHYKLIIVIFAVLTVASTIMATQVNINYDLSSYIPDEADSTKSIEKMKDEFGASLPNAELAMPDLTIIAALELKEQILSLDSVSEVLWLDDVVDLSIPLEMYDETITENYYKNSVALYQITTTDTNNAVDTLADLRKLAGEDGAVRGQIVELAEAQDATQSEILKVVLFAVPVVLLILVITSKSWFEPILFMLVIVAGILMNMGTNLFFSEVSFITQSVAAVMQLAVTMDYAIFFLHRSNEYREAGDPLDIAVKKTMRKSFQPISSSAATTFFGFLVLIFMRFKLGPDMGLVLAKGIIFSLISVFVLLPALIMLTQKLIDKSTHRSFLPSFKFLGRVVPKLAIPMITIIALIIVPVFLGQRANNFLYGMGSYSTESRASRDDIWINEQFGNNMQMAILLPRDKPAKEVMLIDELTKLAEIKSVTSLISEASSAVPVEMIDEDLTGALLSENFSRLIVIADSPQESPETFALAEHIRSISAEIYDQDEENYLIGGNFVLTDMRDTIKDDNKLVNALAILTIAIIIAIAFRSLSLPIILVLTIQISIWINLSLPYFTGTSLNFIGYLIISTVQLGATVDYGILLTQYYIDQRQLLPRKDAAQQAISDTSAALLAPAIILASVGFILSAVSSLSVVSELGLVLGRGALISLFMVIFLLPNLLILFDRLIEKTTWKCKFMPDHLFHREKKELKENEADK